MLLGNKQTKDSWAPEFVLWYCLKGALKQESAELGCNHSLLLFIFRTGGKSFNSCDVQLLYTVLKFSKFTHNSSTRRYTKTLNSG